MFNKILLLLVISLSVSANEITFLNVDLSGSGTALNNCLVEKIKQVLPLTGNQKVVETGFAFAGTFVTHPLFNSIPVLFISYQEDVIGSENEVRVIRDVHVAIPSFVRNGWRANFQTQTVSAAVTGQAYIAVIENNGSFQNLHELNISSCFSK